MVSDTDEKIVHDIGSLIHRLEVADREHRVKCDRLQIRLKDDTLYLECVVENDVSYIPIAKFCMWV